MCKGTGGTGLAGASGTSGVNGKIMMFSGSRNAGSRVDKMG